MSELQGFFQSEKKKVKKKVNAKKISGCESCGAYHNCSSPKMAYTGNGDKGILIVGNPVTKREDSNGVPFTDMSSSYLREELSNIGIDMERDCYLVNSVQCYAKKVTNAMTEGCRYRLDKVIKELKPKKILLLGEQATDMFLYDRIQKSRIGRGNPERFYGMSAPDQHYKCWVHADYHPSFVLSALRERKQMMKKWGTFREREGKNLWHHPQLIKDDNFRIRSLYFRKYLKTILHDMQFMDEDYSGICSFVPTVEEAIGVMKSMMRSEWVFMDFETTALLPYKSDSEILCVSMSDGTVSYSFPFFMGNKKFRRMFKAIMTDPEISTGIANYGFEDMWCREKLGFTITNCMWDTVLAAHIITPTISKNTNLKVNAYKVDGVLGYDAEVEPYIKGRVEKDPYSLNRLKELKLQIVGMYNAEDSIHTAKVAFYQMAIIENNSKLNSIFQLYMRAQEMYSDMSFNGIRVDEEKLIKNEMELERKLVTLEYKLKNSKEVKKWYAIHPQQTFNFNSNAQLSELFFDILGFTTGKKTGGGSMSIDKDVLEELSSKSELAKILCEYKKIFKLKNTDLAGIKRYMHNGRIHPFIGVAVASTGRSNSSSPNLQNLAGEEYALDMIRGCLMAEEGQEFLAYDYKSLEVYSSIGISKDKMMIKELEDPNEDSHTLMTQKFFGEDLFEAGKFIIEARDGRSDHTKDEIKAFIKSDMRQHIKSANFALQYGGSANRIYTTLFEEKFKTYHMAWFRKIGYETEKDLRELCKEVHTYYWERYGMLKEYIDGLWQKYLTQGYIYSKFGFRVNGINSKTFIGNFNSQGSGFVLALLGNLKLWKTLKEKKLKSSMKLTVHDSTEFSVDPEEFFDGDLEEDIHYSMEDYVNKKVRWLELPLSVDAEYYDRNWGTECERKTWEERYEKILPQM